MPSPISLHDSLAKLNEVALVWLLIDLTRILRDNFEDRFNREQFSAAWNELGQRLMAQPTTFQQLAPRIDHALVAILAGASR